MHAWGLLGILASEIFSAYVDNMDHTRVRYRSCSPFLAQMQWPPQGFLYPFYGRKNKHAAHVRPNNISSAFMIYLFN